MLQNALHPAERLDHVRAVVVEVPELPVVPRVRPPKRVQPQKAVLLEVRAHAPALVVGERVSVLLEQRVDARDAPVPGVLQVLQRQPAVLRLRLLPLQRVLGPDPLRVGELRLPGLDVAEQVGDELVGVAGHAAAEVRHTRIRLHAVLQVALGNQDVAHGEHAEPTNFLRRVKHDGREPRRHLGVEPDFHARLDLVLALHQEIKELLRVHDSLAVIRHEADERGVPLVDDLRERRRPRAHQNLPHAVFELFQRLVVHPQKRLRGALLGVLVLEVPHAVPLREVLGGHARLGHDPHLEPAHVEQKVGVVPGIHRDEPVVPLQGGEAARKPVLDVPKRRAPEVHVVLHEAHARVAGPALLVVVPDEVLVVRVGVLGEVPLDQILRLLRGEPEQDVQLVHVPAVQPDRVPRLRARVAVVDELVGHLRRAGNLAGARQPQHQQVQHQAVVLRHERRELQPADKTVRVGVAHVLVRDDHVVLGGDVVGDVVVHDKPHQAVEHGEVHLLKHALKLGLQHHHARPIRGVPNVRQVVYALAPLVHQQRRRLGVRGLDPVREQVPLV